MSRAGGLSSDETWPLISTKYLWIIISRVKSLGFRQLPITQLGSEVVELHEVESHTSHNPSSHR